MSAAETIDVEHLKSIRMLTRPSQVINAARHELALVQGRSTKLNSLDFNLNTDQMRTPALHIPPPFPYNIAPTTMGAKLGPPSELVKVEGIEPKKYAKKKPLTCLRELIDIQILKGDSSHVSDLRSDGWRRMVVSFDPEHLSLHTYRDESSVDRPMHTCSLMMASIAPTDWAAVADWKETAAGKPPNIYWRPTLTVKTISAMNGWKISATGEMPRVAATWVLALEDEACVERWLNRIERRIAEWSTVKRPQETVYWKPKKHEDRARGYIIKHKFNRTDKSDNKPNTIISRDHTIKKPAPSYTHHASRDKVLAPANFTAAPPSPRPRTPDPIIPDDVIANAEKGKAKKVMNYIRNVEMELTRRYGRLGIIHGFDWEEYERRKKKKMNLMLEEGKKRSYPGAEIVEGGNSGEIVESHDHHHKRPAGQPKWDRWLSKSGDRIFNAVARGQGHDRGKFRPRQDLLKELLKMGCDIDGRDGEGATAAFCCAQHDDKRMLFVLTELGANIHIANNDQITPMNIACAAGFKLCAEHLLDQGAGVNEEDCRGITPFFTACAQGYTEIADMILENAHPKPNVNKVSHRGQVPLLAATHRGMTGTVELLLQSGADPNYQMNPKGTTALMIVSELRAGKGTADITRLLIMWGARIDIQDQYWRNAFHAACRNRNASVVKVLVAACRTPEEIQVMLNIKDTSQMTPLQIASNNGDAEILRLMSDGSQWGNISPYLVKRHLERFDAVLKEFITERFGIPAIGKLQFCKARDLSDNCGMNQDAYTQMMADYNY